MKFPSLAIIALALVAAGAAGYAAAPIIRETGAIYLSDLQPTSLKAPLISAAPAYFDLAGSRYAGTLRFPQVVEIQAITNTAYRVTGRAQQGQITGWIDPAQLQKLPDELVANIKKAEERRVTVEGLIAKKEVAIGMTTDEVKRSIGDPAQRTDRMDGAGASQVWEYIRYKLVPQQTTSVGPGGLAIISTTYIKIPTGRLTVNFKEGIVEAINQVEGNISTGEQVGVVVPPIIMY
jgi:hypothetical protein